ncbi:transcription factor 7-like 2 [Syngnathoides biaculeatus]|uniref:transcription factor 7-like 2 n=1 Tax=Syngnathoides biaculeatus TaxID=300417 RepID=UPI002ADE830E|nr:transcription factor 7-like 2 [Syngnathoides biaculeatus]
MQTYTEMSNADWDMIFGVINADMGAASPVGGQSSPRAHLPVVANCLGQTQEVLGLASAQSQGARGPSGQEQVSCAPMVVCQIPVDVTPNGPIFYQLTPGPYFVPPRPPQNQTKSSSKRKINSWPQDLTRPYIKKPPNAFMLFMKEQRPVIKAQFVNKDSATVNKVLGQMWKSLTLEEQQKYYRESERLNEIHANTYPDWSCRDNYGKKKKRQWRKATSSFNSLTTSAPEHQPQDDELGKRTRAAESR